MENVLEAESEEQLRGSLSTWQRSSQGPSYSHYDPYADSSIDFGTHPMDQRETRSLVMKRKVLRHRPDGRVEVFDESPSARPWCQGHSSTFMSDTTSARGRETSSSTSRSYLHADDDWFREDSPRSLREDFGVDSISEYPMPGRAPVNYIAPQAVRQRRTDPVAKLNGYKQDWERYSIPGQDTHQSLRWAVRAQMLQSGLPRRAQRHIVPNTYEVPTMKKRDSLRFGVRWDLAHRLMPRRNSSS
ncbi:centriolar and ciliogenesis-associated protein HYLS1 isoform X2 [Prinia subflava]